MSDCFTISQFEFFELPTRTRFPFRYGIASMTEVPHLFVTARVRAGGQEATGLASEGLPPKWFTKDAATPFAQDLAEMFTVIGQAARQAGDLGREPLSFFDFWRELDRGQREWAQAHRIPPLLAGLGVSLVERAALDGLSRALRQPVHRLIRQGRLGLRLGEVYPALSGIAAEDLLPAKPLSSCAVRHTVGLADPLAPEDIRDPERVEDGLPQDLESNIRRYGLRYFKIKLSGQREPDRARLAGLTRLLERETGGDFHATLDGNENFPTLAAFQDFWQEAAADPLLRRLWERVLVVEQPVHRARALDEMTGAMLRAWRDRPAIIIDESDGAIGDVPRAIELGYSGASHKNCKGIVKGLANACFLAALRQQGQPAILTGEDLCNLGPVALLQDLAMTGLLGIAHVERNGHHYFRGLSMFPEDWQSTVLREHGDLYARCAEGIPAVSIAGGRIQLDSIHQAPFGLNPFLDPSRFTPRTLV